MITITRFHDISAGHRVVGHEGACAHLHGHNYRVYFTVASHAGLDHIGRVIDFSMIKSRLCYWLERNWDHKMLIWYMDPQCREIKAVDPEGVNIIGFNPTAEEMARHLVQFVGPRELADTDVQLISVEVQETRKCSATYSTEFIKDKDHDQSS